jgi:DNA-binding MarR family transcriptional regulator
MPSSDPFVATLREWIGVFMRRSMCNLILYSKESSLSMSQIGALFQINRVKSNVSDLGDGLGITHAAASQMLEHLVHQELIVRSENPHDRRFKQIVLTDKGCQVLQESIQARQGWLDDLAFLLSPGEKEQVIAAIHILIDKVNQLEKCPELER